MDAQEYYRVMLRQDFSCSLQDADLAAFHVDLDDLGFKASLVAETIKGNLL